MGEKTKVVVELSEYALEFVRSRCGSLTVEQYVNRVLENIYAVTSRQSTATDGQNIFDIVEAEGIAGSNRIAGSDDDLIDRFYQDLKKDYREKVPSAVFYARGRRAGLSRKSVERAEKMYGDLIVPMNNSNVKNYINTRVRAIMTYLMQTRREVPLALFIDKCEKSGLIKDEISIAIRYYKNSLNIEGVNDEYSIFMIADMVYDYLKAIYGEKIPASVFLKKCNERGISEKDVESIVRIFKDNFKGIVDPQDNLLGKVLLDDSEPEEGEEINVIYNELKTKTAGYAPPAELIKRFQDDRTSIDDIRRSRNILKEKEDLMDDSFVLLQLAEIIYNRVKNSFGSGGSKKEFYMKCRESGLSDEEIAMIERNQAMSI